MESRTFDKVRKFRKVLAITIVFNCFEIIKEIALSSLNRIPFASFWFFFGYCIINLVTLATSYRLQKLMQIINLALMIFLCVFYSFCYYFIENVEFSIFMVIFLYVYSLHGTYIRLIMAIAVCFLIMHMSFLNSNFLRMDDY